MKTTIMKKYIILALVIIALLLIGNNYYQTRQFKEQNTSGTEPTIRVDNSATPFAVPKKESTQLMLAVIDIGGFDCPSCPIIAENALKDIKGVIDAKTTETGAASRVLYNPSMVSTDDLRKALGPMYTIDRVISEQPTNINKLN